MEHQIPVSIIIATKNEQKNIVECLESVSFFSEIIVVDSYSSDNTSSLAKNFGAKVVDFSWNGKLPKKRQWIIQNVKPINKWIFFLDADERMTVELALEIQNFLLNESIDLYSAGRVTMRTYINGKPLKFGYKVRSIKLLRLSETNFPIVEDLDAPGMGEVEGHYQPLFIGKIFNLKQKLDHNDLDATSDWYHRHIRYAEWDAWIRNHPETWNQVNKSKTGISWLFHILPFRPITFFLYSYFLKLGFLDGRVGLRNTLNYSWYYWLANVFYSETR